jgi:hypothetical protein
MIGAAVAPIIEAGKAVGVLRDDITFKDFIMARSAVVFAGPEKRRVSRSSSRRRAPTDEPRRDYARPFSTNVAICTKSTLGRTP